MITGNTRVFAVLGNPVGHSYSPALHNHWFVAHGVDARYVALPADPDADLRAIVRQSGLAGVNLTAPFKRRARSAVDRVTPAAAATGAINTVFLSGSQWVGDNTDVEGFQRALAGVPRGPVLLLGAGGSAAAVGHALVALGVGDLTVLNRTPGEAARLAGAIGGRHAPLDATHFLKHAPGAALIVNCTTASAKPMLTAWSQIVKIAENIWFDLNYWDPVTPGGSGPGRQMLAAQAAAAFLRFTGIALTDDAVARALREAVPRDPSS